MLPVSEAVIVSFNKGHGKGHELVLVGKSKGNNKPVEVINAFQGQDAIDIYTKLITPSGLLNK